MSGRFKILYQCEKRQPHWPTDVPFDLILTVESRCRSNHSQSAKRLNERGGLAPQEMYAVLKDLPWEDVRHMASQDAIEEINAIVSVYEAARKGETR